ncbi:MAG: STAS domain-containing protein [Proteiniphilum sp.]|nr:STAS domain-containing protein [Proteiniphilum sp.]
MYLNFLKDFKPALFDSLKNYNREKFMADLMSGIIVGIAVALPLAIAFGISSGVTPEKGIITAIIAGFIISLLGGSKVQIGGPSGAFIVISYTIVEQYGVTGLAIATVIAGVMLVLMGVLKLGSVIKFMPYPIIVGFTSGIAVTIFSSQISDLLGLKMESIPTEFFAKWATYFKNIGTTDLITALIGIGSIAIIFLTPKFLKKIPGSLIAIVFMTLLVFFLKKYTDIGGLETIGERFTIKSQLPQVTPIKFNIESIKLLFPSAFTIAMLVAIESLLSATVADGIIGTKHNSNMELVAQGAANIITPFFGGIPATGALARTATNINNGGRTPIAGITSSVVMLLMMLFLGDLTKHIPMACLAGVLVVVSYNMSEWRSFKMLAKQSKGTLAILLTTFTLTVVLDITIAIEVGLILAVFIFINRMSKTTNVSVTTDILDISKEIESHSGNLADEVLQLPKDVEVYEIDGPFFFGVANKFDDIMRRIGSKTNFRIIRMRKVPFIDSTGLNNLEALCLNSKKEKIQVILSGVNDRVKEKIELSKIPSIIGTENICANIHLAVERATMLSNELEANKK